MSEIRTSDAVGTMKLTSEELAYVPSLGLYITEKCDGCGKILNQTVRYTITGKPGVYCSAACRDFAFFGDQREAKKQANGRKCAYCGATLEGKRRQASFCDHTCQMRFHRTEQASATGEAQETVTATQSNQ